MRYIDLDKNKAREVCRLHKKKCTECPLRREHYYEKIKKTLIRFCAYELEQMYNYAIGVNDLPTEMILEHEKNELMNEEINYLKELQEDLLTIIDRKKEK